MTEPDVLVFPDAEDVVITLLGTQLRRYGSTVPIGTQVPNPRPASFLRLIRTGGVPYTPVTDAAQITVEVFGETEGEAARLCQLVRGLVYHLPYVDPDRVRRVQALSGPANYPDPLTAQVRYQQTFLIHLRGAAVPTPQE